MDSMDLIVLCPVTYFKLKLKRCNVYRKHLRRHRLLYNKTVMHTSMYFSCLCLAFKWYPFVGLSLSSICSSALESINKYYYLFLAYFPAAEGFSPCDDFLYVRCTLISVSLHWIFFPHIRWLKLFCFDVVPLCLALGDLFARLVCYYDFSYFLSLWYSKGKYSVIGYLNFCIYMKNYRSFSFWIWNGLRILPFSYKHCFLFRFVWFGSFCFFFRLIASGCHFVCLETTCVPFANVCDMLDWYLNMKLWMSQKKMEIELFQR